MAAPNVVYSTSADPDFYTRKLQMLGGTIESLRQRSEERRQRREQMDRAEVQRFLSAAEGMPELAGTWGQEIKKKYGAKYPEVGPIVDAISKRGELPAMVESAGNDFATRVDALEQQRTQREQQIAQMPDALPIFNPLAMMGGQIQPVTEIPNEEKQRAFAEHKSVDPSFIPFMAAQEMPYARRLAAGTWAKQRGGSIPAPSGFDPFGDDMPDDLKSVLAAQKGILTGETAEASRTRAGLKQSQKRLQEQGYQKGEREAKAEFSEEQRLAREANMEGIANRRLKLEKERIEYQHRLATAREDRAFSHQSSLISQRQAGETGDESDPAKGLAKILVDDSSAAQKAYDKEMNQAFAGLITPASIDAAKRKFVEEHGERPRAVSRIQARKIERSIRDRVEAGEIGEDEVEDAASNAAATYMAVTGRGFSPEEAIDMALGEKEIPDTTPRERKGVARRRIDKIKAEGDINEPPAKEKKATAVALESKPEQGGDIDLGRVKDIIRKARPNLTEAQLDEEVAAYVAAKGGG